MSPPTAHELGMQQCIREFDIMTYHARCGRLAVSGSLLYQEHLDAKHDLELREQEQAALVWRQRIEPLLRTWREHLVESRSESFEREATDWQTQYIAQIDAVLAEGEQP